VASTAKRTTPTVLPAAEIDDDDDLADGLGGQRDKDTLINNNVGNLLPQFTDKYCLDVATQNRLMLEWLLEHHAQWKTEQRLNGRGWQLNGK